MRVTKFSTRHLELYKKTLYVIFVIFVLLSASFPVLTFINGTFESYHIVSPVIWIYIMFLYMRKQWQVRHVSYDDYNFYVVHNDYEIQVPYEDVRSIEIVTLGGLYRLNLFRPSPVGKKIYFKPSLWYPLNFRKVEKEVDMLRSRVRKAWHERRADTGNQLSSFHIDPE